MCLACIETAECHGRISGDLTEMRPSSVGFCAHAAGWRQATARITADTDFVISFMFSEKMSILAMRAVFLTFLAKVLNIIGTLVAIWII